MNDFVSKIGSSSSDITRRVKHTLGMVLGVDDLDQQFSYLDGHREWLTREVIGYGTACGLRVTANAEREVVVSPGVAVSPRGEIIWVPRLQCAAMASWVVSESEAIAARLGEDPAAPAGDVVLPVYVTLAFAECPTDAVPIPGDPCRTDDEVLVPSRIADDFRLSLELDPPEQAEEDAVRAFGEWIRGAEVVGAGDPAEDLPTLLGLVRDAGPEIAAGAVPAAALRVSEADFDAFVASALRIWVTELRPELPGEGLGCQALAAGEDRVLLACVQLPLTVGAGGRQLDQAAFDAAVAADTLLDESDRPILAHLRLVQSLRTAGGSAPAAVAPTGLQVIAAGAFMREPADPGNPLLMRAMTATPNLRVLRTATRRDLFLLQLDGYDAANPYVVTGNPILTANRNQRHQIAWVLGGIPMPADWAGLEGLVIRMHSANNTSSPADGFSIQILG